MRSLSRLSAANPLKPLLLLSVGSFFLAMETFLFYRIFTFLFGQSDTTLLIISRALSLQILHLVFLVFWVMLVYSNLITAVSVFLTSSDMKLLLILPLRTWVLYLDKFCETLIRSSAVMAIFLIPVLTTYGYARGAAWYYYLSCPLWILFFLIIPCALSVPLMLLLARIFPTRRLEQGLLALGMITTVLALFAFRLLRVEEIFMSVGQPDQLIRWAAGFQLPEWSWIPSSWLVHVVDRWIGNQSGALPFLQFSSETQGWLRLGIWEKRLIFGAILSLLVSGLVGVPLLRSTWSRSIGVAHRAMQGWRWFGFGKVMIPLLGRGNTALALKELKVFFRDITRWSQVVIMVPLIGFYLLNMRLLPFRNQLTEIYYLLNLFMIAFIQAAISARYLFPSISWEGPALWILRVSPYSLWRLVLIKLVLLSLPLLVLTILLVAFSFWILEFQVETLVPSLLMALPTTLLLCGLGLGMGAIFPRFRYEHHLEISLGPGGILYMLIALTCSVVYVGILSKPALQAFGANPLDWGNWCFTKLYPPTWELCLAWNLACLLATSVVILMGINSLSKREEFD
jgi:ABC-2 type transport system permease protein